MTVRTALAIRIVITLALCVVAARHLPLYVAFLDPVVRSTAPLAVQALQSQGIWVVNAEIESIRKENDHVCFIWKHQYRSAEKKWPVEMLTTCL